VHIAAALANSVLVQNWIWGRRMPYNSLHYEIC